MTRLDELITSARTLDVRPDHTREYVGELARWAGPPHVARRAWVPWLAGGFAFAAAAIAVFVVIRDPGRADRSPIVLGGRVAIVVDEGTVYRIAIADRERTTIEVERGTVTGRLWPGEEPYKLVLRGADVVATAHGTIYSLTVDERGAAVSVHEGKVAVERGNEHQVVEAGSRWPVDRIRHGEVAARLLAEAPEPRGDKAMQDDAIVAIATLDAGADTVAIGPDATRIVMNDAALEPSIDGAVIGLRDRWRRAHRR